MLRNRELEEEMNEKRSLAEIPGTFEHALIEVR